MNLALRIHAEERIEERTLAPTSEVLAILNTPRRAVVVDRIPTADGKWKWRHLWWCVISNSYFVGYYDPETKSVVTVVPYPSRSQPIPEEALIKAKVQALAWQREIGWKVRRGDKAPKVYVTFVWRTSHGRMVYRRRSLIPDLFGTITPMVKQTIEEMLIHFLAEAKPVHEIRIRVGPSGHEWRHVRSGLRLGKSFRYINEFAPSQ